MGEGSAFAIFYGAMLSSALVIGVAGLALGIIRKKKSTTIIGGFFLAIPAVLAVVVLLASVNSERSPTTTARAPAPSASQPTPGDSSLAGKSVEERLQVLQALSRTSKATIYYPGDPYAGMSMVFIGSDLLAGEGSVAMSIHYAAEASDRSMTVDIYTPQQYAQSAAAHAHAAPATVVVRSDSSDTIYKLSGDPAPIQLVAKRPGAVIVVRGDSEMTASELSGVADRLISVAP